jgi:hypothetical protein
MKRIILVLLVLLMSFGYSENLNKYESKRVFDKLMDALMYGDFDKYSDDPEVYKILGFNKKEDISENMLFFGNINLSEEFQYEVIGVDGNNDKSTLEIKVKHKIINDTQENVERAVDRYYELVEQDEEFMFKIYGLAKKDLKYKIYIYNIKVFMEKENGKWNIPRNDENTEFRTKINMGFLRFVEIYMNKKILTEYEFEL